MRDCEILGLSFQCLIEQFIHQAHIFRGSRQLSLLQLSLGALVGKQAKRQHRDDQNGCECCDQFCFDGKSGRFHLRRSPLIIPALCCPLIFSRYMLDFKPYFHGEALFKFMFAIFANVWGKGGFFACSVLKCMLY